MTSFGGSFGTERGLVFRPPSTANLMIDSADRPNPTTTSPMDIQISKSQALLNGFFTRIATTEVVLEWCVNNIQGGTIGVDISGVAHTINVADGIYTVENLLNQIIHEMDLLAIAGYNFQITDGEGTGGKVYIYSGNENLDFEFTSDPDGILAKLDIGLNVLANAQLVGCPDLRPYRYIDFVCSQLTYAQDVKDSSSAPSNRDVLCRWYFAEDTPDALDAYGFPILMGYTRFCRRRLFNPPKYIKWDNNLPVGNLSFQVYGNDGNIVDVNPGEVNTNWLMTLQISEN